MERSTNRASLRIQAWAAFLVVVGLLPALVQGQAITINAADYIASESQYVCAGSYGPRLILNCPSDSDHPNRATYRFSAPRAGTNLWKLSVCYAAAEARPFGVELNGNTVATSAGAAVTGGWEESNVSCKFVGDVKLLEKGNVVRLSRDHVFPHIRSIVLSRGFTPPPSPVPGFQGTVNHYGVGMREEGPGNYQNGSKLTLRPTRTVEWMRLSRLKTIATQVSRAVSA